LMTCDW